MWETVIMTTKTLEHLCAGTQDVLPAGELEKKFKKKSKLRIKLGVDPTAPDLHLGHAVVLSKLKLFQDYGHDIIFLIGDFTARIGDPSGRSKTRPALSEEAIQKNIATYLNQVSKILDIDNITVRYNSQWLDQLTSRDWISLCSKVTLARIIEREDFAKRLNTHVPVGFHELLYPLLQGYDSVALESDIELGGTDQTFNLLMGRFLQEQYGQDPQVTMTMPILEGLDGTQKMSKSLGNAIGLAEPAQQAFGKIMSISDILMWRYYEVLLSTPPTQLATLKKSVENGTSHPMDIKKQLAYYIIERFWSTQEAQEAQKAFEEVFQQKKQTHALSVTLPATTQNPLWIIELLTCVKAVQTNSEARRLISAGAVKINGEKITDPSATVAWKPGTHIKVGKHRFYEIA